MLSSSRFFLVAIISYLTAACLCTTSIADESLNPKAETTPSDKNEKAASGESEKNLKQLIDLKNAFHLYEQLPNIKGRSEILWDSRSYVCSYNWLDLTIDKHSVNELIDAYRTTVSVSDSAKESRDRVIQKVLDYLYVNLTLSSSVNRLNPDSSYTMDKDLLLQAKDYAFNDDEMILARFKVDHLFTKHGGIPDRSTVNIVLTIDTSKTLYDSFKSIPFKRQFFICDTLEDRVEFWWGCNRQKTANNNSNNNCSGGKVSVVSAKNFIDVNEPLNIYADNAFRISKYEKLPNGGWMEVVIEDVYTLDGITDVKFEKNKTYKYEISRDFIDENNKITPKTILEREFYADHFQFLLFIPSSSLDFSEKILLPFVIPLKNDELEGDDFQIGPGITIPLIAINPKPSGNSLSGINSMKIKFGGTLSYLQARDDSNEENSEDAKTYGIFGGPYISILDLIQFGGSWKVSGEGPNFLPYIGFMAKVPGF